MIVGIGLDLVDIREFEAEVDEKREEWLVRVFSTREAVAGTTGSQAACSVATSFSRTCGLTAFAVP